MTRFRLASEAAAAPLEAADIESNAFDPYDARGSRAARKMPSLTRPSVQRPVQRPAPARVPLLSRSLPEEHRSVLISAFGEPEQQASCAHVFVTFALKGMPLSPLLRTSQPEQQMLCQRVPSSLLVPGLDTLGRFLVSALRGNLCSLENKSMHLMSDVSCASMIEAQYCCRKL